MSRARLGSDLMTPAETARAFGVETSTLARWRRAGKITAVRTPGGARRYSRAEVAAMLGASVQPREETT